MGPQTLPPLRQDLQLERGAPLPDGSPGWMIHDPVQHSRFELDALDVRLLSAWSCGSREALLQQCAQAPELPHAQGLPQRLDSLLDFLREHHLLGAPSASEAAALAAKSRSTRPTALQWLARRHLFLRIPLIHPDAWLQRTLPAVAWLGSRPVRLAWALLPLLGLLLLSRQWDSFIGTVPEFLTPAGLLLYLVVLVGTKVLHELGHAWVATAQGARVSSMGITLMLGLPLLYTDTSDAWRLARRRQRLWIDAAGVLVETGLAGLATLAWTVLPPGLLRDIAFVLATTTWTLTLLVNLNPLARFDGYYFLADAIGMANLQPRAFALAQWWIETRLLGHGLPAPEAVSRRRLAALLVFAALTWVYRMLLGLAAALLVYSVFFRALGVVMLLVEVWMLMLGPIVRWVRQGQGRGLWRPLRVRLRLGLLLTGLAALLALPLDRHVEAPAVLMPAAQAPLHAPGPARVERRLVREGDRVEAGQVLLELWAPTLEPDEARAHIDAQLERMRLERGVADAQDLGQRQVIEQRIEEGLATRTGLQARREALRVRAPQAGRIVDLPDTLQPGDWVAPERELGRIVGPERLDAQGHVPQDQAWRLAPRAPARFIADDPARPAQALRLRALADTASEQIEQPLLSSRHRGPISTRDDAQGRAVPVLAQQRVVLEPVDDAGQTAQAQPHGKPQQPQPPQRGLVLIEAEPVSLGGEIARRVQRLVLDELVR